MQRLWTPKQPKNNGTFCRERGALGRRMRFSLRLPSALMFTGCLTFCNLLPVGLGRRLKAHTWILFPLGLEIESSCVLFLKKAHTWVRFPLVIGPSCVIRFRDSTIPLPVLLCVPTFGSVDSRRRAPSWKCSGTMYDSISVRL